MELQTDDLPGWDRSPQLLLWEPVYPNLLQSLSTYKIKFISFENNLKLAIKQNNLLDTSYTGRDTG